MKQDLFNYRDFEPRNLCSVAVAVVGSAIVGGAVTAYSANKAASAQTNAANKAADTSMKMYGQTRDDLSPFREAGQRAQTELEERMPFLTSPIALTQEWLESTPGYQFTKTQGLKSVQNSAAARGLGVSGAALKGAATFATGLADTTYKTQFDAENVNRSNAYDRLMGLVRTGQSAAAQTGAAGTQAASSAAGAQIGAGNAQAAGYNRIGAGISNATSQLGSYMMYKGLYGDEGGSGYTPNYQGSGDIYGPGF